MMQTSELKSRLIDKIMLIDDDHLLMEATRLIDIGVSDDEQIYVFTDKQSEKVVKATLQIKNGEYLSSEDANSEIEEWLGK